MRVRRTQQGCVERAGAHAKIVDETPTAGEQRGILDLRNGLTGPCTNWTGIGHRVDCAVGHI